LRVRTLRVRPARTQRGEIERQPHADRPAADDQNTIGIHVAPQASFTARPYGERENATPLAGLRSRRHRTIDPSRRRLAALP
jgi:hypothetical protein